MRGLANAEATLGGLAATLTWRFQRRGGRLEVWHRRRELRRSVVSVYCGAEGVEHTRFSRSRARHERRRRDRHRRQRRLEVLRAEHVFVVRFAENALVMFGVNWHVELRARRAAAASGPAPAGRGSTGPRRVPRRTNDLFAVRAAHVPAEQVGADRHQVPAVRAVRD